MLAQEALSAIGEARVTPWVRFNDLWARPARDLHRAGGYLVGLFDELPAEVSLTPAFGRLIYVGETHGPSTNIKTRLWSLAYSIGIVEDGHWGHVAGHSFNRHFGQPDRWAEAAGKLAVAPIPVDMDGTTAPDLRGVLPLLVEKTLLAAHVRRAGRMPLLNDYERVMTVEWQPHPTAGALAQALAEPLTEANSTDLASWLAKACMWKGRTATTTWHIDGDWSGWKATPKRGWSVYLGRSADADHLDWSAWAKSRGEYFRLEPAREIRALRDAGEAAFAFQYGWRTSFDTECWW